MPGVRPNSGLLPNKIDSRDFSHAKFFGAFDISQLPKEFVRTPAKIVDQQATNFCTAAGTSSASEYQERELLSFEFQIAAISRIAGKPILGGIDPRTAMKSRLVYGCLPDNLTPAHLRLGIASPEQVADWRAWPNELWDEALKRRAAAYFKVDGPFDVFDQIRAALWKGRDDGVGDDDGQVVAAFGKWYHLWNTVGQDGIINHLPDGPLVGYHAFDFIGYTVINGKEYLVAQNSYGTRFGKNGLQYFDRATINDAWKDVWGDGTALYIYRDIRKEDVENLKLQKLSLLEIIRDYIMQLIWTITKKPAFVPTIEPVKPPEPPQPIPEQKKDILIRFCLAIQEHEGWYNGSRSWRNNNPGNCKFYSGGYAPRYGEVKKDADGFAIFRDYETGFLYLQNLIRSKIARAPEKTILLFFEEYAPRHDGNDPVKYARFVAQKIGVSEDMHIKELVSVV